MHHSALVTISLIFGLALGLCSASCGPTCPDGQASCGSAGAAGAAGASGAAGSAGSAVTCPELTALQTCMDGFCKGSSLPFCACYNKDRSDISTKTCQCIPFNPKAYCDQAATTGFDPASYDCSSASSQVATVCVGVQ